MCSLFTKSVKARVRLEYWISFCRVVTSAMLRGGGRQRAARHYMLGSEHLRHVVEIDEVPAAHIDGAEAETRLLFVGVHAVEVHEALERGFEPPRSIVARRLDSAGRMKPRIGNARSKEARRPSGGNHGGIHLIGVRPRNLASFKEADDLGVEAHGRGADFLPKPA